MKLLVYEWRISNSHETITKITSAKIFELIIRSISSEYVSTDFKCCGLYLFNSDAIDYSKCEKLAEEASMFDSTLKIVKKTYL